MHTYMTANAHTRTHIHTYRRRKTAILSTFLKDRFSDSMKMSTFMSDLSQIINNNNNKNNNNKKKKERQKQTNKQTKRGKNDSPRDYCRSTARQ